MIESLTNSSLPWEMIILASNEEYADADDLCAVLANKIFPRPLPPIILLTNSNCDLADQEKYEQVLVLTKPLLAAYLVDEIFLFRISKNHTRTEQKKQQLIEKQESKSMSGVHLLVAEDNEINQEVIQLYLQELDVQVTLVNNGQEALEQLEQDSFDGILMDCMMPVMDGYTATRKIRENSKYRDLPIIAVTANAMQRDHKLALASGMNAHIAKPIEFNKLVDVLNQWIKAPKSRNQHFEKHITDLEKTVEFPLVDGIELDGIDTQKGLSLYLNDLEKYLAFMHRFADKNKHFNADFMAALEKDDSETVILAHSLKGLAAQIGASELSLAAQQLESVSKNSTDKNQIINSLALLQPELERVLSSISSLQPLDKLKAPAETINKEKLAHILASLDVFLLEDDAEVLDLLDQLVNIFQDNSCLKEIKILKKLVDKFDFDAAFIQFKKLKPSLEKYL